MSREPLADAFFGFPDTRDAGLEFVAGTLDLLDYPVLVVDRDLRIITANLQGRDTLAWIRSSSADESGDDVLPPTLAEIVGPRMRKRVHDLVRDVAVIKDPPFLFDVFISKGRIRGETFTFVVLMTASTGQRPRRVPVVHRLLEGFQGGAFVCDRNINFVCISDAMLDLVGFSRKELTGHQFTEFNTSEQALAFDKVFRSMIATPRVVRSPAVTYSTVRRGAFVSPVTGWTIVDRNGEAIGLTVVGGFRSRPKGESAEVERRHVLLERAADLMSEAIFITDLDGDILVSNPAAENLLVGGAGREKRNIKTDVPWEIPGTIDQVFAGLAGGRDQSLFNTAAFLPSHKAILKVRVFALRRVSDVVQEVVFVCDDITQEEYLRQTLFRTTRLLSDDKALRDSVLDSVDIPYAVLDEEMVLLDVNEATARRFGMSKADMIGVKVTAVNPNLRDSGFVEYARATIDSGEVVRKPDYTHIAHDGKRSSLGVTLIPVEVGGRRACVVIAESEIPSKEQAQTAEAGFRAMVADAVLQSVAEGILIVDREGTFLEVNEGAAAGSAIPREQIIGMNVRDLIAMSDDEHFFTALWERVLTCEEPFRTGVVKSRSRVDGLKQFVDVVVNPIKTADGRVDRFVVTIHYLRKIKNLEQQIADYTVNLESMVAQKTRELTASNALLASAAERLARTARSGDIMASLKDRQSVVDAFLRQAREVINADWVTLVLRDHSKPRSGIEQHSLGTEPARDRHASEVIDEAVGNMMRDSAAPERVRTPLDNLMVAEFTSESERGLVVWRRGGGRFSSMDADLAHLLCTQISFALPTASYVAEQRREREKAECLRRIAFRVAGIASVREAVRAVAEEVSDIVAADRFFWLVGEGGQRLWVTEIFRRDGPPAGRSAHIDFGRHLEGAADFLGGDGTKQISCERLSDAGGSMSAECRFVRREDEGGLAGLLRERLLGLGFIEDEEGCCAMVPVHLAHHSPSYMCVYGGGARGLADDDICFMCLAASAVGRVWLEADAASNIRRLESAGETMSELAHDFRYPMAKITELLRSLAAGEIDPVAGRDSASSLLGDVEHLSALSREFIDLSRPGADRPEFVDVLEVLESSLALAANDLERKAVRVVMENEKGPPLPPVFASRRDLSRIFINLIANSHEAVDEGGWIRLNAFLETGDGAKPRVVLTFQNSGPPVSPSIRDSLFSPFKSTKQGGTGLGLFSAKRRANANGGDVVFEVEEGIEGFRVWFPAAFE